MVGLAFRFVKLHEFDAVVQFLLLLDAAGFLKVAELLGIGAVDYGAVSCGRRYLYPLSVEA
jgi:hypothetical protein